MALRLGAAGGFLILLVAFIAAQMAGGETWDQVFHEQGAVEVLAYAGNLLQGVEEKTFDDAMSHSFEYYGLLPIAPALALHGILDTVLDLDAGASDSLFRFLLHLSAFVWAFGSVVLVYLITKRVSGHRGFAFLGAVFLALYPVWLGQGFFNYKDLPPAFMGLLALYGAVIAAEDEAKPFRIGLTLLVIASAGAAATKLAALIVALVPWLAVAIIAMLSRERLRRVTAMLVAGTALLLTTYVVTPPAWSEPIRFAIQSLLFASDVQWGGCTISMGDCLGPRADDWSTAQYIWRWAIARLPVAILVLFVPAALTLAVTGKQSERIIVAAAIVPVLILIGLNAKLYDGLRHILFCLPPLVLVVVVAGAKLSADRSLPGRIVPIGLIANLAFFVVDNVTLHPYNFVYFNEPSRSQARPASYDLEYWGFSLREAMQAMRKDAKHRFKTAPVRYFSYPIHLAAPFVGRRFESIGAEQRVEPLPFYLVRQTRWNAKPPQACEPVADVTRRLLFAPQPLRLAFVAACPGGAGSVGNPW